VGCPAPNPPSHVHGGCRWSFVAASVRIRLAGLPMQPGHTLSRGVAESWERHTGRKPTPENLVVPSERSGPGRASHSNHLFQEDLRTRQLRPLEGSAAPAARPARPSSHSHWKAKPGGRTWTSSRTRARVRRPTSIRGSTRCGRSSAGWWRPSRSPRSRSPRMAPDLAPRSPRERRRPTTLRGWGLRNGARYRSRTCGLQLRRLTLYPAELTALAGWVLRASLPERQDGSRAWRIRPVRSADQENVQRKG
jgi:hypothetical protein